MELWGSRRSCPQKPRVTEANRGVFEVVYGGLPFRAHIVEEEAERQRLWQLADRVFPQFVQYREWAGKARRIIPIVQLVPQ